MIEAELSFNDNRIASELYGDLNRNLIALEKALEINIQARGTDLVIKGQDHAVHLGQSMLDQLYDLISEGYPVYPQDIAYGLRILERTPKAKLKDIFLDKIYITANHGIISPKSVHQKEYIEAIRAHDVVFGIGPAGTGKTYLAVAMAVAAYANRQVDSIILARPAVEAGERLGFLPGDMAQKINPYLRPLYDALYDMLGREKTSQLIEEETIEIAPLAFMRGRTLSNAFIILDEAQNTTKAQMKMFLTRLGFGSKAVITGDITQIDLPENQHSGLIGATKILKNVKGLSFNYFTDIDVVRHPLVQKIIRAYDPIKPRSSPKKSRETHKMPAFISLNVQEESPKISPNSMRDVAEILMGLCNVQERELSILLTTDQHMAELNQTWRNKTGPTNVLSFPMDEGNDQLNLTLLGDIIISLDTAAREAAVDGISLHRRVTILLIHGFVHLLGLDHEKSAKEAALMVEKEQELLDKLIALKRRGKMVQLAINVDHVATIRQARGINEPDPVQAAGICELAGAAGIVVHLREDRRHIQDRDVHILRQTVKTKLNLEMGATEEIIEIALKLKPDMITLVPEKRKELTTEGGLNVAGQKKKLAKVVDRMTKAGIPVSMFIDPARRQIKASKDIGATFVEIHTGKYCDAVNDEERNQEFDLVEDAAAEAFEAGLRVNAGHGLNYLTTARVAALGTIEELSIGHAIMARAIFVGLDQAVREMLALLPK